MWSRSNYCNQSFTVQYFNSRDSNCSVNYFQISDILNLCRSACYSYSLISASRSLIKAFNQASSSSIIYISLKQLSWSFCNVYFLNSSSSTFNFYLQFLALDLYITILDFNSTTYSSRSVRAVASFSSRQAKLRDCAS